LNKINLGCGSKFSNDWTNVDFTQHSEGIIAYNLTKGIPFENESFDIVYHSHLLEHFTKEGALSFLKECYRITRVNGIIRVVLPDLEIIARLYLENLEKSILNEATAQKKYEWILIEMFDQVARNISGGEMLKYWKQNPMPAESFVIERVGGEIASFLKYFRTQNMNEENNSMQDSKQILKISFFKKVKMALIRYLIKSDDRFIEMTEELKAQIKIGKFRLSGENHQWMYDRYSLKKLLFECGYDSIEVKKSNESNIPNFNSYLLDIEIDGSTRKPDSLFIEARKTK
jgi:predicted SAM-dependent methyltransferase